MKKECLYYTVTPSVIPAGKRSAITIHPRGENTAFLPGFTYTVTLSPVEATTVRFGVQVKTVYELQPDAAGNLVFSHDFSEEGRYVLRLTRPADDNKTRYFDITHRPRNATNTHADLVVYALNEDLYTRRRGYKGELHVHTCYSDGTQDPAHVVGNYRRAGFDFLAITDHYLSEGSERAMELFADMPVSMTLLRGEECHVPTEYIHAVHVGGTQSVNAYYRAHREEAEREVAQMAASSHLPAGMDAEDYAWRTWIAKKAHEFGGVAILAHPHWVWFGVYFMTEATTKQLLQDGIYDAYELLNNDDESVHAYEIDTTVALWEEARIRGLKIPVVGTSDMHDTVKGDPRIPSPKYTIALAPTCEREDLLEAIRAGMTAAVDEGAVGMRAYGDDYRVVKYVRFLLDNYFPVYTEYCAPEGDLLSERADTGEENTALLELLNQRAEKFAQGFFG